MNYLLSKQRKKWYDEMNSLEQQDMVFSGMCIKC